MSEKESTLSEHNDKYTLENWTQLTGIKCRNFTESELEAFKKPFILGWSREIILKGSAMQLTRKQSEVYYHSPCGKVKLRSYVETGLYFNEHQDSELEPENFTFAKQPIYKAPEETVRLLFNNGNGVNSEPKFIGSKSTESTSDTSHTDSEKNGDSLLEGRGKRKRNAPNRFEDFDFSEQAANKKKSKAQPSPSTMPALKPFPIIIKSKEVTKKSSPASSSPKSIEKSDKDSDSSGNAETEFESPIKIFTTSKSSENRMISNIETVLTKSSESQSNKSSDKESSSSNSSGSKPEALVSLLISKNTSSQKSQSNKDIEPPSSPTIEDPARELDLIPPCSLNCGPKGEFPSQQCSRCLCLSHPQCVPNGIFLIDSNDFVCPNCVQPDDVARPSSKPSINRNSFAMPELHSKGLTHLKPEPTNKSLRPTRNPNSNGFLSSRNANMQQFSSKLANSLNNRKTKNANPAIISAAGSLLMNSLQCGLDNLESFRRYASTQANEADSIEALLARQSQLDQLNRSLLNSQQLLHTLHKLASNSLNGKRFTQRVQNKQRINVRCQEYLNRKWADFDSLASGYRALNLIFEHLETRDLLVCRQVNSTFCSLVSQKSLWTCIQLKSIAVTDWHYFGSRVCIDSVTDLSFIGLIPFRHESEQQMWSSAQAVFGHLNRLRRLAFGKVPISFIFAFLDHASEFSTFENLEELFIYAIYEDDPAAQQSLLRVLPLLKHLPSLRALRFSSTEGLTGGPESVQILNQLHDYCPNLVDLRLPDLVGLTSENFEFLKNFSQIKKLHIGSCESWTIGDVINDHHSSIAFQNLSRMRQLTHLRLIEVIVDESSNQLPMAIQCLNRLESLEMQSVTVSPDATQTLNMLCNTIKTRLSHLRKFSISTADAHTNRCVFELLLKRLDQLQELNWQIGGQYNLSGEFTVPFLHESELESDLENDNLDLIPNGEEQVEWIELRKLNEALQKQLLQTRISISPINNFV